MEIPETKPEARKQLAKLVPWVNQQRWLYHNKAGEGMEVSIEILDQFKKYIDDIEQKYPDLIRKYSPSQTIVG